MTKLEYTDKDLFIIWNSLDTTLSTQDLEYKQRFRLIKVKEKTVRMIKEKAPKSKKKRTKQIVI